MSASDINFYSPPNGVGVVSAIHNIRQQSTDPQDVTYNGSARDTNAAITRAQWADYVKRFQPLESELQGGLTFDAATGQQNHQMIGANLDRAKESVGAAFDATSAAQQRSLRGMGVSVDPGTQSSIQRATAISKAASLVDAENMTRNRLAERNQDIALGSIPSSGRNY